MPKTTNDILFEGYDLEDKYSMNQAELTVNKVTEWEKFVHKKWFSEEEVSEMITDIYFYLDCPTSSIEDFITQMKKKYGVE